MILKTTTQVVEIEKAGEERVDEPLVFCGRLYRQKNNNIMLDFHLIPKFIRHTSAQK